MSSRAFSDDYRILTLIGSPPSGTLAEGDAKMPTHLPRASLAKGALLIQCGRYIVGISILFVALALFGLRLVRASHATARLGERIGGGPPVFS